MRFASLWRLLLCVGILALTACGGGESTPARVSEATTIDFAEPANYAAPALPAYFDATVAALDNSPPGNAINDRVATLGRVLFYDLALSTNDRASCASCHQQQFGFTDPMRFSNGISSAATTEFHAMRLGNLRYWQPGTMFWDRRVASAEAQASHPIHSLVELGWGGDDPSFRQVFSNQFMPDAPQEAIRAFNDFMPLTASAQNAAAIFAENNKIDVQDEARRIGCPTLVVHGRGDLRVPFEEGRLLAGLIPGARFVGLETRNHLMMQD